MKKYQLLVLVSTIAYSFQAHTLCGQNNLILNNCFDLYTDCPTRFTLYRLTGVTHWNQPTGGTPDYFNKCSRAESGIPDNHAGSQSTHCGDGYLGLVLFSDTRYYRRFCKEYREYIQTKLSVLTESDTVYYFRGFISLAQMSNVSTNSISIAFTKRPVRRMRFQGVLGIQTAIDFEMCEDQIKYSWFEVSGFFSITAKARFLTIGNFSPDSAVMLNNLQVPQYFANRRRSQTRTAYYYVDNVLLCKASSLKHHVDSLVLARTIRRDGETASNTISDNWICKDTLITLQMAFENHSAIITDSTLVYELATFIEQTQADSLLILGHTDATDNEINNLNLSLERAKAVQKALLRLSPHLVTEVYGMGSSRPVVGTKHPGYQKENHRVEIYLKTQCQKAEKDTR